MASQLLEQLRTDLNTAMKDRDQLKTSTIRMVLSAVQVASVAGDEATELTDAEITAVLRSEAKRRSEAAELYENAGRTEQAASERTELAVIEAYLPAAMDDATLQGIVDEEIATAREAGAEGPKAMGQVIKAVKDRVGDGADGGRIAGVVKASLV
ncbi:MAG: GatB/YqeY domain-containing protein [Ilumatobacteraceae bacterium]|nr:GatB/YqeY domain-containing protein [Ilumatobacteraceae bacterium]